MTNRANRREARRIDLDAARKARAEKAGPPPVIVLGGKEFTLPSSLPALVAVGLARADVGDVSGFDDVIEGLFGDAGTEILKLGLDFEDFEIILEEAYGDTAGEAQGSAS